MVQAVNSIKKAAVNWFTTIVRCTIFSWTRSALNLSLNLNWQFRATKRWTLLFSQKKRNGGSYKYWHANSGIFERNEAKQTTWSERTTRRTHEIRQQRVSRMISPLEAHRSPSIVGASRPMSHSSSVVLLQHNKICIRRKSPEIYNF